MNRTTNSAGILMRIGTWNVDNRVLSEKHRKLLLDQSCDVWLVTEMNRKWADADGTKVLHFHSQLSKGVMSRCQHWAAILSVSPLIPLDDPHPASTAAVIGGITFCSTVLPWRGVKAGSACWSGASHAEMTASAVATLLSNLPSNNLVWGGDWNHSLSGEERAGSEGGRNSILDAIEKLVVKVPTANLLHRNSKLLSIDHIGVPKSWWIESAQQISADGLSDHDAYVIEIHT